jgi:hypothetical protein
MTVSPNPYARRPAARAAGSDGLADVLERILDKGLVIAGDIQINLLDIELITIKVRLLLASADTAQQMGIDWWKHDPFLTGRDRELAQENQVLRDRVDQLETAMGRKLVAGEPSPGDLVGEGAQDEDSLRGQRLPTGALVGGGGDGPSGEGDGPSTRKGESGPQEVEVDELILQHESGGPGLRMTAVDEAEADDETVDEQHLEGVDELILEHAAGGPELRVTAADLEALVEERTAESSRAPEDEQGDTAEDDQGEASEDEQGDTAEDDDAIYWLDEETIAGMTRAELQGELEARDLATSGNKATLRERLLEALEDEWETVTVDGSADGSDADDG